MKTSVSATKAYTGLLFNEEVRRLDPFDPYLTAEQKTAINLEAKQNACYFLVVCMQGSERAPVINHTDFLSLEANHKAATEAIVEHIRKKVYQLYRDSALEPKNISDA